jgi:hypothetical protein
MISICVGGSAAEYNTGILPTHVLADFRTHFSKKTFIFVVEPNADFLLSVNHNKNLYRKFIASGGSKDRAILIRLEPDSVFPKQYRNAITKKYGLVISPGSTLNDVKQGSHLGWPYQYHLNPAKPVLTDPLLEDVINENSRSELYTFKNWDRRPHKMVLVAGNKVSPVSSANYAIRRKLAHQIPKPLLEVYGPLWNDSLYLKLRHRVAVFVAALKQGTFPNVIEIYGNLFRGYPNSRGMVDDKHNLLKNSKYSLVIENSNSIVTEKLFDSILNGCIPIYIGPDLDKIEFPRGAVIPVEGESKEITEILSMLNQHRIEKYLMEMSEFIISKKFLETWGAKSVYSKVAQIVHEYIEINHYEKPNSKANF